MTHFNLLKEPVIGLIPELIRAGSWPGSLGSYRPLFTPLQLTQVGLLPYGHTTYDSYLVYSLRIRDFFPATETETGSAKEES